MLLSKALHVANLLAAHPRPDHLLGHLRLSPELLPAVLSHLHRSHAPALLSLSLFLHHLPSPSALHSTLLSLSRARLFPAAAGLLLRHPALISPSSLSILLSHSAKCQSFRATLHLFDELRHGRDRAGAPFCVDEFNVLLRAFCVQSRIPEVRHVFNRYYSSFLPNSQTLNILLLGFKKAGNLMAMDLFYDEMVLRGFEPDCVSYNVRIDAYCKKGRFLEAVEMLGEMEEKGLSPTLKTMTSLVYGAGIAGDVLRALEMFAEIRQRGLCADAGAYNALMGIFVRSGEVKSAMEVFDEMETKGIEVDDVSYYTMFSGLLKELGDGKCLKGVCELYDRMGRSGFVPRTRTAMLLMKAFCENARLDTGLQLWDYIAEKGGCLHRHVFDVLLTGLCSGDRIEDAFRCLKQAAGRGRRPSVKGFRVLEGALRHANEMEKLEELQMMMIWSF